eukprot:3776433-Rhodomonas_salina.1
MLSHGTGRTWFLDPAAQPFWLGRQLRHGQFCRYLKTAFPALAEWPSSPMQALALQALALLTPAWALQTPDELGRRWAGLPRFNADKLVQGLSGSANYSEQANQPEVQALGLCRGRRAAVDRKVSVGEVFEREEQRAERGGGTNTKHSLQVDVQPLRFPVSTVAYPAHQRPVSRSSRHDRGSPAQERHPTDRPRVCGTMEHTVLLLAFHEHQTARASTPNQQ